jgi:hypothetical protein
VKYLDIEIFKEYKDIFMNLQNLNYVLIDQFYYQDKKDHNNCKLFNKYKMDNAHFLSVTIDEKLTMDVNTQLNNSIINKEEKIEQEDNYMKINYQILSHLENIIFHSRSAKFAHCKKQFPILLGKYLVIQLLITPPPIIDPTTGLMIASKKITTPINPNVITFTTDKKYTFKPVSIVLHSGATLTFGHYINLSLRIDGGVEKWVLYDDSPPSKGKRAVSYDNFDLAYRATNGKTPYLILYEKVSEEAVDDEFTGLLPGYYQEQEIKLRKELGITKVQFPPVYGGKDLLDTDPQNYVNRALMANILQLYVCEDTSITPNIWDHVPNLNDDQNMLNESVFWFNFDDLLTGDNIPPINKILDYSQHSALLTSANITVIRQIIQLIKDINTNIKIGILTNRMAENVKDFITEYNKTNPTNLLQIDYIMGCGDLKYTLRTRESIQIGIEMIQKMQIDMSEPKYSHLWSIERNTINIENLWVYLYCFMVFIWDRSIIVTTEKDYVSRINSDRSSNKYIGINLRKDVHASNIWNNLFTAFTNYFVTAKTDAERISALIHGIERDDLKIAYSILKGETVSSSVPSMEGFKWTGGSGIHNPLLLSATRAKMEKYLFDAGIYSNRYMKYLYGVGDDLFLNIVRKKMAAVRKKAQHVIKNKNRPCRNRDLI